MNLYKWVSFLATSPIEAYGGFYFFSAFFRRRIGAVATYVIYYVVFAAISLAADMSGYWKMTVQAISIILLVKCLYDATWRQTVLFSSMYMAVFWLTDIAFLGIAGSIDFIRNGSVVFVLGFDVLYKTGCVFLIVLIKKAFAPAWDLRVYNGIEWYRFMVMPVATIAYGVYVHRCIYPKGIDLATGIMALVILLWNVVFYKLLQDMVLDRIKLNAAELKEQKMQSRIEAYNEMEDLLRMQRKKLHDYKNQVRTIGNLIADGNGIEAKKMVSDLTESLDIDSSTVDTKNAAVNAILNQKYKAAKEHGIGMTFLVGDLSELTLPAVDVVIILGNLLDNAMKDSEKVRDAGEKAVIRVAVKEEGQLVIFVKNPVNETVEIKDNRVIKEYESGHGIGLLNVEETVEKYDGSFGISCNGKVFTATVII